MTDETTMTPEGEELTTTPAVETDEKEEEVAAA